MSKTILIAGYGPGISSALAERFGQAGFQIALVARTAERLAAGVKALESKGINARSFTADVSDPSQAQKVVTQVRAAMGPIDAVAWTAYGNAAGDLLAVDPAEVRSTMEIATGSLLAAVREALPDLRDRKGAVLVTNGSFGLFDEKVDAMAVQSGAMGLALANSAKHKLVGLLAKKLRADGVFVGEVMVLGLVKGTAFDRGGHAAIEPEKIAAKFWELYSMRASTFTQVG
ncbi:SDR family NAD(P)-dependent oxidoreductase [Vulgatibacter incomptus]|uniref:Short-chain dehydrogenase/reductase SDR n=1 Tax=Vulgatibacter incomptus TaxID=1391653 RepID=A0A0K1PEM0_9BACT|nr:SDR family NAD(P)-dependent oxidoreductase [Vulgatibacter incomptus]AKU91983.1 Short-chain dehydrogenase/reductase SDR [Vulgatibacter incomptus]